MREDRLLKLAGLLEADANNPQGIKFDLETWTANSDSAIGRLASPYGEDPLRAEFFTKAKAAAKVPLDCGTTACAFGLAAISGIFADEGLTYEIQIGDGYLVPMFEQRGGFDAAAAFFEIGLLDAYKLFSSEYYSRELRKGKEGELAVADRIRTFMRTGTLVDFVRVD